MKKKTIYLTIGVLVVAGIGFATYKIVQNNKKK